MPVRIKVVSAQLTRDTDTFSNMDPYCILQLGSQRQRTKTKDQAGKKPVWNQLMTFNTNQTNLVVKIMDEDTFSDDVIAEGNTNISQQINSSGQQDAVIELRYQGKSAGKLHLKIIGQGNGGNQFGGNVPNNNGGNQWGGNMPNNNNGGNQWGGNMPNNNGGNQWGANNNQGQWGQNPNQGGNQNWGGNPSNNGGNQWGGNVPNNGGNQWGGNMPNNNQGNQWGANNNQGQWAQNPNQGGGNQNWGNTPQQNNPYPSLPNPSMGNNMGGGYGQGQGGNPNNLAFNLMNGMQGMMKPPQGGPGGYNQNPYR